MLGILIRAEEIEEEDSEIFSKKKMKRETLTLLIWDQRAVHFMTR